VHPPRFVAAIRVVVAREEVAELVESQLLRIPQPRGENFESGSVRLASQDGAGVGEIVHAALRLDVEAPVPDGKIETTIRAENETVQVMADESDVDAEAVEQRLPDLGAPVPVGVAELPQLRECT
jgi:hypothetical protein